MDLKKYSLREIKEKNIVDELILQTSYLDLHYNSPTLRQRFFSIKNDIKNVLFCSCGKPVSWTDKHCYRKTCGNNNCKLESYKLTNIEKFGVDNPSKSVSIQEKIKQSNIEKFGVDNYSKTDVFKNDILEKIKK